MIDVTLFRIYELYVYLYGGCRSNPARDPYHGQPKTRPWWPMRYFMEDWVLGAWVYRIDKRTEQCNVCLFLAEDHYKYKMDSGLKGSLIFLLTQAYHLLGNMEINFVGPERGCSDDRRRQTAQNEQRVLEFLQKLPDLTSSVSRNRAEELLKEGFEPEVPAAVRRFASELGVKFAGERHISDAEGRDLYARMTGFSAPVLAEFNGLGIDLTRACYAVHRDILLCTPILDWAICVEFPGRKSTTYDDNSTNHRFVVQSPRHLVV